MAKRIFIAVGASTLAALLCASVALADASDAGYGGQGGGTEKPVESGGSLPFTGLDLALLVGGGVLLLSVGFVLRRVTRARI